MNIVNKVEGWGSRHHPKILDLIRTLLGGVLIAKAWVMLEKFPNLQKLSLTNRYPNLTAGTVEFFLNFAIYAYSISGVLLFLGLQTRLAASLGLPVALASVFFVDIISPFMNTELFIHALIISLLFQFMVIGPGPISLDRFTGSKKLINKG